jgi:single-strand DNA-binding protein
MNFVLLIGNLGRDPETRYTTSGSAVCNFSIATTETWKNKDGEKQERTEWHNIVCFGHQAEFVGEYIKKGRKVAVRGKLQTRKWQDKEGNDRYTTEIVAEDVKALDKKQEGGESKSEEKPAPRKSAPKKSDDDLDDDIPF